MTLSNLTTTKDISYLLVMLISEQRFGQFS
jgi:hypothetical protein